MTADNSYIITNTANGFNVNNYISTKTIIMPLNKNIDNLIAITEKEHNKYMELVEANMDKELSKNNYYLLNSFISCINEIFFISLQHEKVSIYNVSYLNAFSL